MLPKDRRKRLSVRFRDALGRWGMTASDSNGASDSGWAWDSLPLTKLVFVPSPVYLQDYSGRKMPSLFPESLESLIAPATNYGVRQCTLEMAPDFLKPDRLFVIPLQASLVWLSPIWMARNEHQAKTNKVGAKQFFSPGYRFSQSLTDVIRRCQLFEGTPLTVICYNSNWAVYSVFSLDHNAVLCSLKIILRKECPELTEIGQKSSYGHWQLWLNLLDKFRKGGYIKV